MKIHKIGFALGSKAISIRSILGKSFQKVNKVTGISRVYHVSDNEDTVSLATKASKKVLNSNNKRDIDAVILITQTPKYNIPPNSYVIHQNLNLKKNCLVFDINQGCSGYIYGLKIAESLLNSKEIKKILLITSDNYSRYCKKLNVKLLFSDCATATVLEQSKKKPKFEFFSDGSNYRYLCQQHDNYKSNINQNSLLMNGNKLFNFSLDVVPHVINKLFDKNKVKKTDVDYVLLHQASHIINQNIISKLEIKKNKFLTNYKTYGNTVSSTIPLLLISNFKKIKKKKILMCGFGVGLSVGACFYEFE